MKQVRMQKYKIFEKFETHQHKLDFLDMINDFRKEHLRNSEYEKVTMDKIDELSKDVIFLTMYDYNLEKDVYDKPIGLCELSLSKRGNRDTIGVITVYFKEKYRGLNLISDFEQVAEKIAKNTNRLYSWYFTEKYFLNNKDKLTKRGYVCYEKLGDNFAKDNLRFLDVYYALYKENVEGSRLLSDKDIKDMFVYVESESQNQTCIGIKSGKFGGVVYKYGKVSFAKEEDENGNLPLQFQYDIVDNNGIPREQFNDEFFNLIGDILVEVMDEQTKVAIDEPINRKDNSN